MNIVGITGGIGSGKTTIAAMFKEWGIPVYIADEEAKKLMNSSATIQKQITALFGAEAYQNNQLNRKFLASKVFNDQSLLNQLNQIVHPEVKKHFKEWVSRQQSPYLLKESAILFEKGDDHNCDKTILVTAPKDQRIARVKKRDNTSKEEVLSRMNNQWEDEQKLLLTDYVIKNDRPLVDVKRDALGIHNELLMLFS